MLLTLNADGESFARNHARPYGKNREPERRLHLDTGNNAENKASAMARNSIQEQASLRDTMQTILKAMTTTRNEAMTQPTIEQMVDWCKFHARHRFLYGDTQAGAMLEAIHAVLTEKAGDGWQPIETAPKPSGVIALACFDKAFGRYFVFPGHWYSTGKKWVFDCHILGSEPEQPRFWRQMPQPPKAAAKDGAG